MSRTQALLDALIQRLEARVPDMAVSYFPDRPSEYDCHHPRGALLVSFLSSRPGAVSDTGLVVQEVRRRVSVTVIMRQLNGQDGALAVLDQAREALLGYTPPGGTPCRLAGETFLGHQAGIWQYGLDFDTDTVLVPDVEDEDGPLLKETIHEEMP